MPRPITMDILWNSTARVSRLFACLGGALVLVAALLVSAEVIARKVLAFTYSGSDELAAYLFALGTTWSLAHVLVTRGHVRIDPLYGRLSLRLRTALDVVSLLALGVLAWVMLERGWDLWHTNYLDWSRANTPLRTPLALPQLPWLFGLGLFFAAIAIALVRTLLEIWRGDLVAAGRIAGLPSQDDEIAGELDSLNIAHKTPASAGNSAPTANQQSR